MDWSKKYKELTSGYFQCIDDVSKLYPDCNDFEKCVIGLRLNDWTYGGIQKKLGMPPKKEIRDVLKKWAPNIIDNSKSKKIKVDPIEAKLYNIIRERPNQQLKVVIDDEDYTFYIANHKLLYEDWSGSNSIFEFLDERTKQQFLNEIMEQLDE